MTPRDLFELTRESLAGHKIRMRLTIAAIAVGVASVLLHQLPPGGVVVMRSSWSSRSRVSFSQ